MSARRLNGKAIKRIDNKTLVVMISYSARHPLYMKVVNRHKKCMCHVDDTVANVEIGDNVIIEESAPVSKRKKWKLLSVLK